MRSSVDFASTRQDNSSVGSPIDGEPTVREFGQSQSTLRDLMNVMNAAGTRDPVATGSDFCPAKVTFADPPVATQRSLDSPVEMDEAIEAVAVESVPSHPPSASSTGHGDPVPQAPLSAVDRALANASAEWQRRCVNVGDDLAEWRLPSSSSPAAGVYTQPLCVLRFYVPSV